MNPSISKKEVSMNFMDKLNGKAKWNNKVEYFQ